MQNKKKKVFVNLSKLYCPMPIIKATPTYQQCSHQEKIMQNRKYSAVKIPPKKNDIVFKMRSGNITPRKTKKREARSVCGRSFLRLMPIHMQIQKDLRHYLSHHITPITKQWPFVCNFSIQRNETLEKKHASYTTSYNSLIKKSNESMPNIFIK